MTVADLLGDPYQKLAEPFCRSLPTSTQLEIACATVLTAVK